MISKERLQELIDKEATIWADDYGEIQLCDKSNVYRVISFEGESYCLYGFIYDQRFINDNIFPEELEEDVEKGKWEYEMHTSRIERFRPPTYEEMIKEPRCLDCWTKEFVVMSNDIPIGKAFIGVDFDCEIVSVEMGSDQYFVEQLTKDNYIKACTIARKLFLGESIEEGENNEESKN